MSDFMDKWLGNDEPQAQPTNVVPIRKAAEGIHPYAAAIVAAWTDRLQRLKSKPWVQGDAWDTNCYATARKLTEVANSPWSGYSHSAAHADYFNHAPHDSVWDKRQKCWERGSADAGILPEPEPSDTYVIPPITVLPDDQTLDDFWHERRILAHLHTYARARRVAPWAVLGYALARIVAATPPSIALPPIIGGYASLNLFVGIVGTSGAGKGAANAVARAALKLGHLTVLNPGSGEGIIHAYAKRTKDGLDQHTTSVLFNVPEIDTLAAVGSRQGSTVMPILRSGWSGEQIGTQTADPSRRVLVEDHRYRMCMVAGIQPGRAGAILDDADGGTPQRFLWLPATDPRMPDHAPEAPERITIDPRDTFEVHTPNGLHPMGVCDQARDTIIEAHLARVRGDGDALDGHALLTRLKTAAALALLEERKAVTDDDWRLAGVVMAVSDATRANVMAHRAAARARENEARGRADGERQMIAKEVAADAHIKRVAKGIIRHLDGGEMVWSTLRKKFSGDDKPHFEDAIGRLEQAGQIKVDEEANRRVVRAL